MTLFQIIMVCFGFLTLCGGIIAAYTKNMVEIAKIQVSIQNLQHQDNQREQAVLKLEARNSVEHDNIIRKIDELINKK